MRRSVPFANPWAKYRFKIAPPRVEGPAPIGAPQSMNSTRAVQMLDPINDPFPVSIRGTNPRPDVTDDQYVDQFYFLNAATPFQHELTSHSANAPEGSFRFRPYSEFDRVGRTVVEKLRAHTKASPFKEWHLSKMRNQPRTAVPSPATIMDRAVKEHHRKVRHVDSAIEERDVGRVSQMTMPNDDGELKSLFPFRWNTDDWYEHEVANIRLKRFFYENKDGYSERASEVTYKLVLGTNWDHHAKHLADDVCAFIKDIGRQTVQEKLHAVRNQLASFGAVSDAPLDDNTRKAFNSCGTSYDDDEIRQFIRRDLEVLEQQCIHVLALCNSSNSDFVDVGDQNASWPSVETLEPWKRMVEFWTQKSDTTFTEAELSTRKYEFRKFFRVVVVKMPFQSMDFERRLYDIRHWLHRRSSVDFHTIYRKNVIHDNAKYPTEHDPATKPTHEDHRMYSFAIDWQQAPVDFSRTVRCEQNETWTTLAKRLGCSNDDLKAANTGITTLEAGQEVVVPVNATNKIPATARGRTLLLRSDSIKTWEDAAATMNASVEEVQAANGAALAVYVTDAAGGHFAAETKNLIWPIGCNVATTASEFMPHEATFANDTFETVATRLGTTIESLKHANPTVNDPSEVSAVVVPSDSAKKRRSVHPLSRSTDETAALFPALAGTVSQRDLPAEFPVEPSVASQYPAEYSLGSDTYPVQPNSFAGSENWIAYTATYLDKDLSIKDEPTSKYAVNPAWPHLAVPGTAQQTPFEEDQTWLLSNIPMQRFELSNPKQHLQDLPQINNEQFAQSMQQLRP